MPHDDPAPTPADSPNGLHHGATPRHTGQVHHTALARRDVWQCPPLAADNRLIAGVCAGLATELGIDRTYLRVLFVVLVVAGGWGLVLYGAAWWFMHRRDSDGRPYQPIPKATSVRSRHLAFGMVALGLVLLAASFQSLFQAAIVWPVALVGLAFALAFDRSQLDRRHLAEIHTGDNVQLRLVMGLFLLLAGITCALMLNFTFWQAMRSILVAGLVLAGTGVLLAPVIARLGNELLAERRRRIRSEERAEMAAHLHDSVLQTLSLIQKRSDDVGVVNLARRQERELRTWLFDDKALHEAKGFRASLEVAMAEIEDLYETPIEVVVVGDRIADADTDAILMASREAATNAVRHSGASRVDVFAELSERRVEVFVRDQGRGFDPDAVDGDRAGIRESIRGRVERHGGEVAIVSKPGAGTEVELSMPLRAVESDSEGDPANV